MADEAPDMHKDFPRWYAAVAVGDDGQLRAGRWAAIHTITQGADAPMVEGLVRLAFATKQPPSSQTLTRIHQAYREADDTFDSNHVGREMQVLAGATLAVLMEANGDSAATAALSVATAVLTGGRTTQLPMDLPALAEAAIERLADANRTRPSLNALMSSEAPKFDFETAAC